MCKCDFDCLLRIHLETTQLIFSKFYIHIFKSIVENIEYFLFKKIFSN